MSKLDQLLAQLNAEQASRSPEVQATLRPGSSIFFVGEAPGAEEVRLGAPFVGASGRELRLMLREVGIDPDVQSYSNVIPIRPPNNKFEAFCGPTGIHPAWDRGLYVREEFRPQLDRLFNEIKYVNPCIVVALGKTALWALARRTDIGAIRGYVLRAPTVPYKLLTTHHPARLFREWSLRTIALADLAKAKREAISHELIYDHSEIWINPLVSDLYEFERRFIHPARPRPVVSDIETIGGLIRCVGFAPTPATAIVVPFISHGKLYWPDREQHTSAWAWVKHIVNSYPIMYHNGAFDVSFKVEYGLVPRGYSEDTMLMQHALYPELRKSLEFLGSIHAHRPPWKKMRPRGEKPGKREG